MEIVDLQRLAGIKPAKDEGESSQGMNMSLTASEKARIMREKKIAPGTPAWFKLWFSLPYLTGERPV